MATRSPYCRRSAVGDAVGRIVHGAIDVNALDASVDREIGGVVRFLGIVRASSEGRTVTGLSYEAYEPMALATFAAIAEEARDRFGDVKLSIVHASGDLAVGDVAVAVTAQAAHRAAAFDACRYAIDELKQRAPIWKQERYAGGDTRWRSNDGIE